MAVEVFNILDQAGKGGREIAVETEIVKELPMRSICTSAPLKRLKGAQE